VRTLVKASSSGTSVGVVTTVESCKFHLICWVSLIAIAFVKAWFTRDFVNADAVSYLDISRMIVHGNPRAAINACWSPGYTLLLAAFFGLIRPSIYWESTVAHLVNVFIFAGALAGFYLFWSEVRRCHLDRTKPEGIELPESTFWILGYSIFAVCTLNVISLAFIGPDLAVAALCCFAGWSALRLRRAPGTGSALLLSVILALGYYVKAPFLPMGFMFVVCSCLGRPALSRRLFSGALAITVFSLLCSPYIAALSQMKERFTFGDSARLNHAFYLDGVQKFQHWQGGPAGAGQPVHPTRKLNAFPQIYEFAAGDMGTYPPWFDPTYWYEGITPRLHWKLQAKVLAANFAKTFQIVMESATVPAVAAIILCLLSQNPMRLRQFWPIWMPGAIALLMFALVHVEPRYLGGWLILLFGGLVCTFTLPTGSGARYTVRQIGLAILLASGATLTSEMFHEVIASGGPTQNSSNFVIAVSLNKSGLHPGDSVAIIGDGADGSYWAHLAHLRVIAEIPADLWSPEAHPARDFWDSGTEKQQEALEILQQTGARAVIAGSQSSALGSTPSDVPPPWSKIDGTWAYVYFFHDGP